MNIPQDFQDAMLPDPIQILRRIEQSCLSEEDKQLRTFKDYNNAVITTFKEYYDSKVPMNSVNIYEALSRVALHLFGISPQTVEASKEVAE